MEYNESAERYVAVASFSSILEDGEKGSAANLPVIPIGAEMTNMNSEFWRGLSTLAGSWIGGGANQTALKRNQRYT